MRGKSILAILFLTMVLAGSAAADTVWLNTSGDGLWRTPANWSLYPLVSPDIAYGDKAKIGSVPGSSVPVLIDSASTAGAGFIVLGDGAPGALHMTGGTLNLAQGTQPGSIPDSWFIIGYGPADNGTFTLDGGTVTTTNRVYVGFNGTGTIIQNGGAMTVGGVLGVGYADNGYNTGRGFLYLNGGTLTASNFQMGYPAGAVGKVDITGGTLIIYGDVRTAVNAYVDNGLITAYGGLGTVVVTLDSTSTAGTIVTGTLDPTKARKPYPRNNNTNLPQSIVLNWVPGVSAVTHDIYVGTDPCAVANANHSSSGIYKGSQSVDANSYAGSFELNTTYYWRVDEVTSVNTVHGDLWNFRIESRAAMTPTPPDTYANVKVNPTLKWTGGPDGVSYDVYFGTDLSAVTSASRIPGDLDGNGRVDYQDILVLANYWVSNLSGSPYGGVNSDNIIDFKDFSLLSSNWLAQANSIYKGNRITKTFVPGSLAQNTIYYWRVDDVNGPIIRKGGVWAFKTVGDTYSMVGKIMAGYQGWFTAPGDGSGRGWVHWGNYGYFTPQYNIITIPNSIPPTTLVAPDVTVDFWPDMTEYGADEKYPAPSTFGANQYVFSSYNRKTVTRHFQWMHDYGIDGVFMQRFVTEINNDPGYNQFTTVLANARDAANLYGRKYAVMYDMTNMAASGLLFLEADWKKLVDNLRITRNLNDNAYICHNGKPVVAIWGVGWFDATRPTAADCLAIVNFLKDDPNYGGNTVMIGVKDDWLSTYGSNPTMQAIVDKADIISPWTVSSYKPAGGSPTAADYAASHWQPDIAWCNSHGKNYMPVVFPGYSRRNLDNVEKNRNRTGLDKITRMGGQFIWDGYYNAINSGANMIYQAMFDESNEGTQMFKITNSPPSITYPTQGAFFLTYQGLPSDEYLWLCGQGGRMLRGELSLTPTRPARP